MFDQSRAKELQQKSHTRGMLSKQFYSQQQMELQRKRRQMKNILDQQVEQRRRKKQSQKLQQDKRLKREEQQLRYYYANLQERQKKNTLIVQNTSNNHSKSNFQTAVYDMNQSRVKQHYQQNIQNIRQRVYSRSTLADNEGDIPLLPVMALSDNNYSNSHSIGSNGPFQQQNYNFQKKQSGNIPLLDLGDQGYNNQNAIKIKKKSKAPTKRQKTYERQNFHIGSQPTINQHPNENKKINTQSFGNQPNSYQSSSNQPYSPPSYQQFKNSVQGKEERRKTYSDQQSGSVMMSLNHIQSSKVSRGQFHEVAFKPGNSKQKRQTQIPEQIEQYQNQNKQLKNQLKKSQQAISLLIGAVRSNAKLDKFRVQAERILHAQNQSMVRQHKNSKEKAQQQLMLPKLTLRHQSIMHDYMINAAKKSHKSKTFKY